MSEQLKTNITSSWLWVRFVYMLLFSFFLYIASFVVCVVVVVQFLFCLIGGTDNRQLRRFANSLAQYIKDGLMFLTFNSEYKPFPFADWPEPVAGSSEHYQVDVASAAPQAQSDPRREPEKQESRAESASTASETGSPARDTGEADRDGAPDDEFGSPAEHPNEQAEGRDHGGASSVSQVDEHGEEESSPKDEPPKPKS